MMMNTLYVRVCSLDCVEPLFYATGSIRFVFAKV